MNKAGALILLLAGSFSAAHAEQFGTADEARAMLDRAIAALNVNKVRALSEFNDTKNTQFHDRDLYISCYNIADGKFTAFPSRLGVSVTPCRRSTGRQAAERYIGGLTLTSGIVTEPTIL